MSATRTRCHVADDADRALLGSDAEGAAAHGGEPDVGVLTTTTTSLHPRKTRRRLCEPFWRWRIVLASLAFSVERLPQSPAHAYRRLRHVATGHLSTTPRVR